VENVSSSSGVHGNDREGGGINEFEAVPREHPVSSESCGGNPAPETPGDFRERIQKAWLIGHPVRKFARGDEVIHILK
jgi:hypothetical protein